MRVIDMFGANRYWAEIMAPAVGPTGQVIVWQPDPVHQRQAQAPSSPRSRPRPANVALISSPFEAPLIGPDAYDFMIMNLDYHDVYWQSAERKIARMEPDAWLKTLYAAMKPGAVVGIIDHAAKPGGDTRAVVEKLHRIDPAVVRADFERAGFVLEARATCCATRPTTTACSCSTRRSAARPTASSSSSGSRVERGRRGRGRAQRSAARALGRCCRRWSPGCSRGSWRAAAGDGLREPALQARRSSAGCGSTRSR